MKILISGASGLFGSALMRIAKINGYQTFAFSRSSIQLSLKASNQNNLDSYFDDADFFIHAAANTDVEACEADPYTCYRDNLILTELLVGAAKKRNIPVVFISSTGVYGKHKNTPWFEYDEPNPTTCHHHSKLLAEKVVLGANYSNLVVRTGWLFGGGQNAKNFVVQRIKEAQSSTSGIIFSNQEQYGCPTFVDDLAQRVLDLMSLKANGIFNVVNTGAASRLEYVQEIVRLLGLGITIVPTNANNFKRIAPVSNNEMAVNWRSECFGLPSMRSWTDALTEYLASNYIKEILI